MGEIQAAERDRDRYKAALDGERERVLAGIEFYILITLDKLRSEVSPP